MKSLLDNRFTASRSSAFLTHARWVNDHLTLQLTHESDRNKGHPLASLTQLLNYEAK